jgi:cytochrome b pre-mRNA-processing protein 3
MELGMLRKLFGRKNADEAARALYEAIVAQARRPAFYVEGGVPDTLDGRFDLLVLHVFLVLHRLRADGPRTADLAQALFDLMFVDMDRNLRELGVGDMSVGRKVKTMAKALLGRIAAYEPGLSDPSALDDALGRNLYRGQAPEPGIVERVRHYVGAAAEDLRAQATEALMAGDVRFVAFGN